MQSPFSAKLAWHTHAPTHQPPRREAPARREAQATTPEATHLLHTGSVTVTTVGATGRKVCRKQRWWKINTAVTGSCAQHAHTWCKRRHSSNGRLGSHDATYENQVQYGNEVAAFIHVACHPTPTNTNTNTKTHGEDVAASRGRHPPPRPTHAMMTVASKAFLRAVSRKPRCTKPVTAGMSHTLMAMPIAVIVMVPSRFNDRSTWTLLSRMTYL